MAQDAFGGFVVFAFEVVRFGEAQNHNRVEVVAHVVEDLSEAFARVVVAVPDLPCLAVEAPEVAVAQIVAECDELLGKGAGGGGLLGAQVFKDVFQKAGLGISGCLYSATQYSTSCASS